MITFRLLNENPLYDYREACKITQGIMMGDKEKENTLRWLRTH